MPSCGIGGRIHIIVNLVRSVWCLSATARNSQLYSQENAVSAASEDSKISPSSSAQEGRTATTDLSPKHQSRKPMKSTFKIKGHILAHRKSSFVPPLQFCRPRISFQTHYCFLSRLLCIEPSWHMYQIDDLCCDVNLGLLFLLVGIDLEESARPSF